MLNTALPTIGWPLHGRTFFEAHMSSLYELFGRLKIKPNLIQTGAINVQLCFDDRADKIDQLAVSASEVFDVQVEKQLSLLTIRHHTVEIVESLTRGKDILLSQRTKETVQVLFREN